MVIYSGFFHSKWWFSIVMLVYQRVVYPRLLPLCPWATLPEKQKPFFLQRSGDAAGGGGESDPKELLGFFSARFFLASGKLKYMGMDQYL